MTEGLIYQGPPPPGPIDLVLTELEVGQREPYLLQELNALFPLEAWVVEGVTIWTEDSVYEDGMVLTVVHATDSEGVYLPGINNPYVFAGMQRYKVSNGTWHTENLLGFDMDIENLVEDFPEATRRNISGLILGQARAAGWGG